MRADRTMDSTPVTAWSEAGVDPDSHSVRFIEADYSDSLDLDDGAFDLLVSLYAGFVSEACTRHLRVGGCCW